MNKQDLISKWGYYFNDYFIADLNSVIDNEIAKAQEAKPHPEELKGNCSTFDGSRLVDQDYKPAEQPSSQVKLDNSFDKERFEAMFRAAIAVGKFANFSDIILWVETSLQQLDAYYASKNN